MENINETEQWKLDGICAKCRRVNYCGTDCTANKKRIYRILKEAMGDVLKERLEGETADV